MSGANGEFSLPVIERSSLLGSLLPHEPNIRQSLTIRHAGKNHEAWLYNKHSYTNNDELEGRPIRLVCRLESQAQRRGRVYGICEFELSARLTPHLSSNHAHPVGPASC